MCVCPHASLPDRPASTICSPWCIFYFWIEISFPDFPRLPKTFFFPAFCAVFQFRLMLDMFVCTQGNQIMATISDRPHRIHGCIAVLAVQAAYCDPWLQWMTSIIGNWLRWMDGCDTGLSPERQLFICCLISIVSDRGRYLCNRASKAHTTYSPIELGSSRASGALDLSCTSCMEPFYVFSVVVYTSPSTSVTEKNAGVLFCCQVPDNHWIFIFGWTHLFNSLSKTVNSVSF